MPSYLQIHNGIKYQRSLVEKHLHSFQSPKGDIVCTADQLYLGIATIVVTDLREFVELHTSLSRTCEVIVLLSRMVLKL